MDTQIKQEKLTTTFSTILSAGNKKIPPRESEIVVIDLSNDEGGEGSEIGENNNGIVDIESGGDSRDVSVVVGAKRARSGSGDSPVKKLAIVVAEEERIVAIPATPCNFVAPPPLSLNTCKQFWKAGDYEGSSGGDWEVSAGGFDHVRVHPKFLHSNATSHKWSLGAFAELLDNALDEVHSGATYVNVDMIRNKKDGNKMVLIEDNGGGMNPDKMRHCMSLGYSAKSKLANTIGQYGNGFKTSTMRLGADVIVFSRCSGKDGKSSTQSIGLLSYSFLTSTGKEDIVVPMLDYERIDSEWCPIIRSSVGDWEKNVETVVQWSPYTSQEDLLRQFNLMRAHGTKIIIYNLWEDDEGMLELDFDTDPCDIQLRGVNRDEKNIYMASQYPNSRHYLTYKHSLRSYASILYLKVPKDFRIILRGKDVEHHNIVNDMMQVEKKTYRPKEVSDGFAKNSNFCANVTVGFVKDAKDHVDVQGFNVYHKNRLIKPFWRIWNAAGSDGRGVIGVLEADFVEPAHDKQGFERTTVYAKLEARLLQMQKDYWRSNCHKIGYAARQGKKSVSARDSEDIDTSPDYNPKGSSVSSGKRTVASRFQTPTAAPSLKTPAAEKFNTRSNVNGGGEGSAKDSKVGGSVSSEKFGELGSSFKSNKRAKHQEACAVEDLEVIDSDDDSSSDRIVTEFPEKSIILRKPRSGSRTLSELEQENDELKERLNKKEDVFLLLQEELRREKELRKALEAEVQITKDKLEEEMKEQESLIKIFAEEEEKLKNKLEEALNTVERLKQRR
ncbi:Protein MICRORCHIDIA 4 [Cardamine amara subsp. amara]|uniref:Protein MICRORCHIDIA 4 n=1 Tax=Cardamine amara subsp. amara TaxID=228776 RepID=A0ABD1BNY9_CARAN